MTLTQNYKFAKFGLETEICPIFGKFVSHNKSNMLFRNMILASV